MNKDYDEMEYGSGGLTPLPDGWYKNVTTGETMDPNGCVFDVYGELVFDPHAEEQGENEE